VSFSKTPVATLTIEDIKMSTADHGIRIMDSNKRGSFSSVYSDMQSDDSLYDHPIFSDATHSTDSQSDSVLSPTPSNSELILQEVKHERREPPVPLPKTFDTSVIHNMPKQYSPGTKTVKDKKEKKEKKEKKREKRKENQKKQTILA